MAIEVKTLRRPLAKDWLARFRVDRPPEQAIDELTAYCAGLRPRQLRHMDVAQLDAIKQALIPEMYPRSYRAVVGDDGQTTMYRCDCCRVDECERSPRCVYWVRCEAADECDCGGEMLFRYRAATVGDAMDAGYDAATLLARLTGTPLGELREWPLWKYRTLEVADAWERSVRQEDYEAPPFA